ncbi:MAG TPA: hypothetical protein VG960_12730 [Caulobacteraceae bacterium]|nr:hypothetical protein [Caulobacteraceae bacterium]
MPLSFLLTQWRWMAWAGLGVTIAVLTSLWRLEAGRAAQFQAALLQAQAVQASALAQAASAKAAGAVLSAGAARDAATGAVHTENEHAIQSAPGSGQGLDRALNDAGRRGLCQFRSYWADPACVQLRGDDSGRRADAGGADAFAAP